MEILNKKISDLREYENNPRNNEAAVEAVANSIKEFGFKVPIIVTKDNVIIAGHTRYKASHRLGLQEVPCIVADDLSEEQIKAFRLVDNKTSELATWDLEKLEEELAELNLDMSIFGFEHQLSDAFKILGVEEETMKKSFIKLNSLLGDIAQGNGSKYEDILRQIGLSTEALIGLNPDDAFNLIRNSLSKLEDETLRVAVANQIFGDKIGAELAQVISATSNEISALKDEVEALGIITDKEAEIAGRFTDIKRANKKEDKLSGKNEGIIISDISYIKSSTERIEKRLDKLEVINTDTTTRVAVLERDVKSLSKAKYARKGI